MIRLVKGSPATRCQDAFCHRCAGRPARSRRCKSSTMKVIGPKPCAGVREDVGEASAGERAGQPLSRDRKLIPGADAVCVAEGDMFQARQRERLDGPAWS